MKPNHAHIHFLQSRNLYDRESLQIHTLGELLAKSEKQDILQYSKSLIMQISKKILLHTYDVQCLGLWMHAKKMNKRFICKSSFLQMIPCIYFRHLKIKSPLGLCLQGKEYSLRAMTLKALCMHIFLRDGGEASVRFFHFTFCGIFRGPALFLTLPWGYGNRAWCQPHSPADPHAWAGSSPGGRTAEDGGGEIQM